MDGEDDITILVTAVIIVRGKIKFVLMTMEKYGALREMELTQAVHEAQADYEAGRVSDRSIDDHIWAVTLGHPLL